VAEKGFKNGFGERPLRGSGGDFMSGERELVYIVFMVLTPYRLTAAAKQTYLLQDASPT
jgi:hypothetical protein